MARRVRWMLLAATVVAALAPTPTAGAALRGRVTRIEALGAPAHRRHARGVDDEHVAPIPVPGSYGTRRVGRVAIVLVDARPWASRRRR